MIGSVQPVSYSNTVFKVQPVTPVRGKEQAVVSSLKEETPHGEAFFTQNKSGRLLDIII